MSLAKYFAFYPIRLTQVIYHIVDFFQSLEMGRYLPKATQLISHRDKIQVHPFLTLKPEIDTVHHNALQYSGLLT